MLKVAKEWMMAIDAGFAIITGYSIIEVLGFIFAFSLEELTDYKIAGSIVVTISATIYWVFRLSEWIANRKLRKENEELTNNILKLQHESELRRQEFEKIELESKKFEVELTKKGK